MFSRTLSAPFILAILSLPLFASAQTQQPDGVIVPFTSELPACASLCGKLFDVQGACSPPAKTAVSESCFCGDPRLTPFTQGTSEVEQVCGAASCQDTADLQKIQSWYESYCNLAQPNPTSTSGSTATGSSTSTSTNSAQPTSAKKTDNGWFSTHWKWVVMVIVLAVSFVAIWVGAILIRRRYIRKKEREIEMRPPVAWGPHQMQGATGGYGEGVMGVAGGKEKARSHVYATPSDATKTKSKGWLKKSQR